MTDPMEKATWEFLSYHGERPDRVRRSGATLLEETVPAMSVAIDAFLTASLSQEDRELVERARATRHVNLAWPEEALAAIDAEQKTALELADRITALSAALAEAERERDDLVLSTGEHITKRSEYLARAEAAESALRTVTEERDGLREALKKIGLCWRSNYGRQHEKLEDIPLLVTRALTGGENG